MARTQSAERLAETAHDLIDTLLGAARAEGRADMAYEIGKLAKASAKNILATMHPNSGQLITDDFRAGLALAAELLADPDFG